jgi:hypothetical protein
MRLHLKPVRKCNACLLNLGASCWMFESPRKQWRGGKTCPGLDNEDFYRDFRIWQKRPTVKSGKEIRRDVFRGRRKTRRFGDRPKGE